LNILIDNNLPPAIARALHELCKADGHRVVPLRDKFDQTDSDIHWVSQLRSEGGWAVVSQDKFTTFRGVWRFTTPGKFEQLKI
jgi:predicted nuclease of predicted toxin-antitoxin system